MTERLSSSDMSSLLAERGPIHVHVGATIVLEGKPPPFDEFLEHVQTRLALVPRFRQRVTKVPLGLSNPEWSDDPAFDLEWHVRHLALPRPGSMAQLRELVGRVMSEPLDFNRPLWQLYLIEGLEKKRHAAISKTHHALVDGVSAVDVGTIMLDPNPEGTEMEISEERVDADEPSPEMLLIRGARDRIRRPLKTARKAALGAVTMPRETASRVIKTAEGFTSLAAGGPSAKKMSINVEIGRDRRLGFASTTLDQIKGARGETGATVNDVILAVATGALRTFLEGRGDRVPDQLVALVPMSIRRPEEQHDLGNRIATLLVPLPLGERDPVRRLETIHATTTRLKESEQAHAASLVIEATGWAPPTINRVLSGAMNRPLTWNLVISNVPGPQLPFYLLGSRMREVYPFVPLSPQGHALSIGVVSYDGGVYFGLVGDRDALADIDDLSGAIESAIGEQVGD